MDILSHGLWAAVGATAINRKSPVKKVNLWLAGFWGAFPDLFAFVPSMIWLLALRLQGKTTLNFGPENADHLTKLNTPPYQLSAYLYNFSHSLIIFFSIVIIVMIVKYVKNKKIILQDFPLVMLGWLLHIIMDIPTHTYKFYPTPIFWPIFGWEFKNGFSWGQPWFLALDYGLLILCFVYFRFKKVRS